MRWLPWNGYQPVRSVQRGRSPRLARRQVNVVMDVSATVDEKWDGLNCHRTQFGPSNLFRRLPEPMVKQMMSEEYFALAWPEPEPGLRLADLFDGLS